MPVTYGRNDCRFSSHDVAALGRMALPNAEHHTLKPWMDLKNR